MSQAEIKKLAEAELGPYGIDKIQILQTASGYKAIWRHEDKEFDFPIPRYIGKGRGADNFARDLKRFLASHGIQKCATADDKILHHIEQLKEQKRALAAVIDRVGTIEEMILDLGTKFERLVTPFQMAFGQSDAKPAAPAPAPFTIPDAPVATQPAPKPQAAEKSFQALAHLIAPSKAALEIAKDTRIPEDERVLRFLDELGVGASLSDMERVGLVGIDNGTFPLLYLLGNLEERGFLSFDRKEKIYDLTPAAEDLLNELDEASVAKSAPITGGAPVAQEATVVSFAPRQPRILEAVAPINNAPNSKNILDSLLIHLHMKGPQTTTEIRLAGIKGYGVDNNVGQLMQRTKNVGYVKADRGRWYLTQEGKDKIKNLISTGNVSAVNNDLRRQFNR